MSADKINDGGPAFPMQDAQSIHAYAAAAIVGVTDTEERDRLYTLARGAAVGGMTLRDYFIAALNDEPDGSDFNDKAKEALVDRCCPSIANDGYLAVMEFEADFRAAWRALRADAMLEARKS